MWPASDLLLPPFKLAPLSNRAASTRSFFEALIADDDFWPTADAVIPQSLGDLVTASRIPVFRALRYTSQACFRRFY
jgi:hypothetical protein